ncbi:MAG: Ig-like domain-containing protein, partial [Ignavibacteriales bacterium]|nr:Ig-like domain-containing protein [Ignavibacteriales bacterium]
MKHFVATLLLMTVVLPAVAQQTRPVQIVTTSPTGRTRTLDQSQTIAVTFNQAMTALKEVPQDEDTGPMIITPAIKGKYRWQGTATLTLIPSEKLPYATAYKVTIPGGTKSVTGQALATTFEWTFETPRPQVVERDPDHNQRFVELDYATLLRFNQPIDPQQASKSISIEERAGGQLEYPSYLAQRPESTQLARSNRWQRRWQSSDRQNALVLIPGRKFKKGATITVRVKPGLTGIQGQLPSTEEYVLQFTTYNEFSFLGLNNADGFDPRRALEMRFSNPVYRNDLLKHIAFVPQLKLEEPEYDYPQELMYLQLSLEAETQYTGFILPGMKDQFGQEFKDTVKFQFRTGSFPPFVQMTTGQGVLEAYESHKYPVTFMNIDSVRVQMGRVNPEKIVEVMQRLDYSYYQRLAWEQAILTWMDRTSADETDFSLSVNWPVKTPKNKKTVKPLDLDAVLGKAQRGIVLAQIDNLLSGDYHRYLKALVQVTNMGLTTKFSPEHTLVWVTNLKDASPVAKAAVEIRNDSNKVVWKGTTDANGFAKAPGWFNLGMKKTGDDDEDEDGGWYYGSRQPRQWILVRFGDDVAFSSSEWNQGIEPWQFNVQYEWNPNPNPRRARIFTDRGLYKAGEQVEIKGIVRELRNNEWRITDRMLPLQLKVRDSRNEEVLVVKPKISPFGSFALSLPLKPTAPLGYYSIQLSMKKKVQQMRNNQRVEVEKMEPIGGESFRVEAFRAAEFEVTARFDRKSYIIGDSVGGMVMARYLFGGAMKEAPLRWRISSTPTGWFPEGFDGYAFGPMYWLTHYQSRRHDVLSSDETNLDDNGGALVRYHLRVGELQGPQSLMLEGDVTSPARQQISGRTSVLVHGSEHYLGIQLSGTFIGVDSTLRYKLVAVDTAGKQVVDRSISLKLYRRIWRSVRRAETGGRYSWVSSVEDSLTEEATVTSLAKPLERTFVPKSPGLYFFTLSGKDNRGNEMTTQEYFYVSGSGYVAWERSNDDRIELIADKTNYKPGDVAHIIVKSPYERAPAMISIEREGVLQHFRAELVGSAPQIDIPIKKEFLPNVYVSVILLQGRVEGAAITKEADVGRPSFKIGYIGLSVSPNEKQLKVAVQTDKKEYRPGDSVWINITTTSAQGKGMAAEVALSVADLGVLNLINYRMPNPFFHFYSQRGLA